MEHERYIKENEKEKGKRKKEKGKRKKLAILTTNRTQLEKNSTPYTTSASRIAISEVIEKMGYGRSPMHTSSVTVTKGKM